LVILGTSFVYELSSRVDARGAIAAIAVLLAAIPALSMSLRINSHDVDPRTIIPPIIAASGARVVYDRYSDYQRNGRRILGLRMRPTKDTADIVVTANLAYDRFEFYAARKGTVQQTVRPITGSFSCGLILRCRMDGRPWPTSIRWCGLLPWTDRWRG